MAKCKLNFDNKSVTTNNPQIQQIFKDLKGSGTDEIVSKLLDEFNIDMDTDSTNIKTYLKNYTELELKQINKILKNLESEIEKQNNQPAEDQNLLLPGLDTAEIEDYSAKELEEFLFANVSGVSEYQSIEIRDQLVNTILLGGKDKNSEVLVSQKNLLSRLSSLIYGSIDEPRK